jgi:hypothetical protein
VGFFGGGGPWQQPIGKVLKPHFDCVTIKYPHYRWMGWVSPVVEPWVLIPCLTIILGLAYFDVLRHAWLWVT